MSDFAFINTEQIDSYYGFPWINRIFNNGNTQNILCIIIDLTAKNNDKFNEGWLRISNAYFQEKAGVTEHTIFSITTSLEKTKIIETKLKAIHGQRYKFYKLNIELLKKLYEEDRKIFTTYSKLGRKAYINQSELISKIDLLYKS